MDNTHLRSIWIRPHTSDRWELGLESGLCVAATYGSQESNTDVIKHKNKHKNALMLYSTKCASFIELHASFIPISHAHFTQIAQKL